MRERKQVAKAINLPLDYALYPARGWIIDLADCSFFCFLFFFLKGGGLRLCNKCWMMSRRNEILREFIEGSRFREVGIA